MLEFISFLFVIIVEFIILKFVFDKFFFVLSKCFLDIIIFFYLNNMMINKYKVIVFLFFYDLYWNIFFRMKNVVFVKFDFFFVIVVCFV